jgi:hypothetical protein
MDVLAVAVGIGFLLLLFWGVGVVARHYRTNGEPVRFPRMVQRLGLSMKRIGDSEIAIHLPTAARLCLKCRGKKECDEWLAEHESASEPPKFCVNSGFLRLARRMADTPY